MSEKRQATIRAALSAARDGSAPADRRLAACAMLLRYGVVEPAMEALGNFQPDDPRERDVRMLLNTGRFMLRSGLVQEVEHVSRDGSGPPSRTAIPDVSDAVLWRSRGSRVARNNFALVFTGKDRQFWVSLDLLHRILRTRADTIVYLRDPKTLHYLAGVEGLGQTYEQTLDQLLKLIREAGTDKVYVLGTSLGGHGALRYGLDLAATAVLSFSPTVDLEPVFAVPDLNPDGARRLDMLRRSPGLDVAAAYRAAERRPVTTVVWGDRNPGDTAQAERLRNVENLELRPVAGFAGHDTVAHLIGTGEFKVLLDNLFAQ